MKKAIIIGGGFTGFTWAYLLAEKNWSVTILEKSNFVGGGIRTLYYNGHPYTHGPRLFVTKSDEIFSFVNNISQQRLLKLNIKSYVAQDDRFYSFPPHMDDVEIMPDSKQIKAELEYAKNNPPAQPVTNMEQAWKYAVGPTLYEKLVNKYTCKAWGLPTASIIDQFGYDGKGINLRTGTHQLFTDFYSSYPISMAGWDDFFSKIAEHKNIYLRKNIHIDQYDMERKQVMVDGQFLKGDLMVSTISPDVLFDYKYGELPYMGRKMSHIILPIKQILPDDLYFLHYTGNEPYTRIVEYDKITGYDSPNTLLGIEYPCAKGGKDYPYPFKAEIERAYKYINELPDGVISAGRLGRYKYMSLSDSIEEALNGIKEVG